MLGKMFIKLINMCVKFPYLILTKNQFIIIINVNAILTILYGVTLILLITSTNCKNQITARFKNLVEKLKSTVRAYAYNLPSFIPTVIHVCVLLLLLVLLLQFSKFNFHYRKQQTGK
jgi:hypothetical protein